MDHGTAIQSAGYLSFDGHTASGRFLYGFGATQRDTTRIDKDYESPVYFAEAEARKCHVWMILALPELYPRCSSPSLWIPEPWCRNYRSQDTTS